MTARRPGVGPTPRGTGRARRDRRVLRRGGEGVAAELNRVVARWPDVRVTPMFGRWGYFVGAELFGCYPIRTKDHDLWVRLSMTDQARALQGVGVRAHRRFAARGWVECDVTEEDLPRALRWLRRAYEHAARTPGSKA
jgi:hypothetical protein